MERPKPESKKMNPLQESAQRRGIESLVHFTRLENLPSIMRLGLVPRSQLEAEGIRASFNDGDRIDGCIDATCLSINFPNYKMFWACRKTFLDVQWVVLTINPNVIWEKDCAFCHENAASKNVTCIPLANRKGIDAFDLLYEEVDSKPSRKDLRIPDRAPTNPQAEVLVFDIIKPELIKGVLVEDQVIATEVNRLCPGVNPQIISAAFKPRKDYAHWK